MAAGKRIADLPDLGVVTDDARFVGDHLGSGLFSAPALRDYIAFGSVGDSLAAEAAAREASDAALAAAQEQEVIRAITAETQQIAGSALIGWPAASGAIVSDGTYVIFLAWPWAAGRITGLTVATGNGSFLVAARVGAAVVSGLSAVLVNGAVPSTTAAGANALMSGDVVSLLISASTSSPSDASLQLNFTRSRI